jgi:hypothetical protein
MNVMVQGSYDGKGSEHKVSRLRDTIRCADSAAPLEMTRGEGKQAARRREGEGGSYDPMREGKMLAEPSRKTTPTTTLYTEVSAVTVRKT